MVKSEGENDGVRIDKWLWAVRLFKTRSLATEACRAGRVIMDDVPVKPSRSVKEGDTINLRRQPSVYTYRVLQTVGKRQPASLVANYLEDLTTEEEKEKARHRNLVMFVRRDRGAGRPTKKERRILDRLSGKD